MIYLVLLCLCATPRDYLDAVRSVESSGNANAVGDGGRSIGPYQIQRAYWLDSRVPGRYEHVRDRAYAERVVLGYAKRYEPRALRTGDWEALARLHNAGPGWRAKRKATDRYWNRVNAAMPQKGK